MNKQAENRRSAGGFTLVELLIVIGIIVLLISILVPAVSYVRRAGQKASVESFMANLARAIEAYEMDFRAYPGPLTNNEVYNNTNQGMPLTRIGFTIDPLVSNDYATPPPGFAQKITMSENLVLGLLGGLQRNTNSGAPDIFYDPRLVGGGAYSLAANTVTKRYKPYIEAISLSWRSTEDKGGVPQPQESPSGKRTGHFRDDADLQGADDSVIPEIVDPFPEPLPILYLRARRGARANAALGLGGDNNSIITYHLTDTNVRVGQYDLYQIIAYTKSGIGVGRKTIKVEGWNNPPTHGLTASAADPINVLATMEKQPPHPVMKYSYPYNAYPYFRNHALSTPKEADPAYINLSVDVRNDIPRQKDGYIIISAGADRRYGTEDDITNFGAVRP